MIRRTSGLLFATTIALAACASDPIVFHSLLPSVQGQAFSRTQAPEVIVTIRPTGIPAFLDRPELVLKQPDGSLLLLENARWADTSFGEEVHSALRDEVTRELNGVEVSELAKNRASPALTIQLQIRRLESTVGKSVYLAADWSVSTDLAEGSPPLICRSTIMKNVSQELGEIVDTQRKMLLELFQQVARSARTRLKTGVGECAGTPPK